MSLRVPARSFLAAVITVLGLAGVADARDEGDRRVLRQRQDDRSVDYEPPPYGERLSGQRRDRRHWSERRSGHRSGRSVPDYRVVIGRSAGMRTDHEDRPSFDRWPSATDRFAPASVIVGSSRFSGDAASWYASGSGSYFTLKRYGAFETAPVVGSGAELGSRIIRVDRDAGDRACSFEAGVCVIRGR